MAKKSNSPDAFADKLQTHQDWEIDTPNLTEKEKKRWYTKHVEETQAGNPNMRKKRVHIPKFPPPTAAQKKIMEKLDFMGNPVKGWKWKGNKLVKDKQVIKNSINELTEEELTRPIVIKTRGFVVNRRRLRKNKKGYLINEKGERFKFKKR